MVQESGGAQVNILINTCRKTTKSSLQAIQGKAEEIAMRHGKYSGVLVALTLFLVMSCRLALAGPALSGLVGWYQASSLSLSNGAAVGSWNDLSGNGNTLTAYGSGITYVTNALNGQSAVSFNGGGYFNAALMNGLNGTSFEMFAVVTGYTSGTVADVGQTGNLSSAAPGIYYNEAILGYQFDAAGNGTSIYHETSPGNFNSLYHQNSPGTSPYLLDGVYGTSATSLTSYVNGVASTDAINAVGQGGGGSAQPYTAVSRQLEVGDRGNESVALNGQIAALLVYNTTLTAMQEQQTGYYLQSMYGISGTYTSVPEPATPALVLGGVALVGLLRKRVARAV